jgi:hypothetical protein
LFSGKEKNMKTNKRVEQTGRGRAKPAKASEKTRGGGPLDAKAVRSKAKGKAKGKATENVRTPN